MVPFKILCTVPLFFSNTRISSGPKKSIVVGNSRPSATTSISSSGGRIDTIASTSGRGKR